MTNIVVFILFNSNPFRAVERKYNLDFLYQNNNCVDFPDYTRVKYVLWVCMCVTPQKTMKNRHR